MWCSVSASASLPCALSKAPRLLNVSGFQISDEFSAAQPDSSDVLSEIARLLSLRKDASPLCICPICKLKEAQAWLIFVAVLHSLHVCWFSARPVPHRSLLAQLVLTFE